MGFQEMSTKILEAYEDSHIKMQELNSTYKRTSTLPIKAKKEMIILFRTGIEQDIKILDAVKNFMTKKSPSTKSLNRLKCRMHKY